MKTKILTLGNQQDYYEVQVEREAIHKVISEMSSNSGIEGNEELLLERLKINGSKISACKLTNYGGTVPFQKETMASETMIDGLERFFKSASKYAERHGTPYVLVQNLKISGHRTLQIQGLSQLLIQ